MVKKLIGLIATLAILLMNVPTTVLAADPALTQLTYQSIPTSVTAGENLEFVAKVIYPDLSDANPLLKTDFFVNVTLPSSVSVEAFQSTDGTNFTSVGQFTTAGNFWLSDFMLNTNPEYRPTLLSRSNLTKYYKFRVTAVPASWTGNNLTFVTRVISALDGEFGTTQTVIKEVSAQVAVALKINTFTITPAADFDPSNSGENETLSIAYDVSETADSLVVEIRDTKDVLVRTLTAGTAESRKAGTFTWDGEVSGKIAVPGTYKAKLTAVKAQSTATQEKTFTVSYNNSSRPGITDLLLSSAAFDPDVEDVNIQFKNTRVSEVTVEIYNGVNALVRTFDAYTNDSYSANTNHSVVWDGKDNSANKVVVGTYKAEITTRNEFGASFDTINITVDNSGGSFDSSNAHIGDISLSPSSTFEPEEDDELVIEFDVKEDLDSLKIVAVRGAVEVELESYTSFEEESNNEITWDGTSDDDDEFVAAGTWRIEFRSRANGVDLLAGKYIEIDYEQPVIEELLLSKEEFDPELGEFTNILFKVDTNAEVDIFVLEDGVEDDEIEEDLEVEKDRWNSVEWDGGGYDEGDDIQIRVVAKNIANDNVYDSETINVDLKEDDVSSTKSNVTNDFMSPAVAERGDTMELSYEIEDDADVVITIHKGDNASGTKVIELLDVEDQDSGDHTLTWGLTDDDGDLLDEGIYSWKIISDLSSTDTEKGVFVVGDVGEGGGSSDDDDDDDSGSGGGTGPNVIIDGQDPNDNDDDSDDDTDDDSDDDTTGNCGGYGDVLSSSRYCNAIEWVTEAGIFSGDEGEDTFRPYSPINRAEALKVALKAADINPVGDNNTATGFRDTTLGEWYIKYINTAKALGIFSGDDYGNTARPSDDVNRAEILKFAFASLDSAGDYTATACSTSYPDTSSSSAWYNKYVCESKKYSLFELTDGTNFTPNADATRGEVALMFYRMHLVGLL